MPYEHDFAVAYCAWSAVVAGVVMEISNVSSPPTRRYRMHLLIYVVLRVGTGYPYPLPPHLILANAFAA